MDLVELDGVGKTKADHLKKVGITTVEELLVMSPPDLQDIAKLDADAARILIRKARASLIKDKKLNGFVSGSVVKKENQEKIKYIKTNVEDFDKLLGGGLETGGITEFYGEFGSGKTQFCYHMAVQTMLPEDKGGLNGNVLWLDTEGTFKSERIEEIATARGIDPKEALEQIFRDHLYSSELLQVALEEAIKFIDSHNIKLLVVDSGTGLFRDDYDGRGELSERQKYLKKFMSTLNRTVMKKNIACIFTNQVSHDPGQLFGDSTKPIGGNIVAHATRHRIYLKSTRGKTRKHYAKMVDSGYLPDDEIEFNVDGTGIITNEE